MNPSINREKMLQIMFEKYNFKAVYVGIQAMLTLYAQGKVGNGAAGTPTAVPGAMAPLRWPCDGLTAPLPFARAHVSVPGLTTGVVVDAGDGVTHIVAVSNSYVLPHLTRRLNVAGRDVTKYLVKLMLLRG